MPDQEISMKDFLAGEDAPERAFVPFKLPNGREIKTQKEWDRLPRPIKKQTQSFVEGAWNRAVEKQGDFGLPEEVLHILGKDAVIKELRPITNIPSTAADLGVRALQGMSAVADTAAQVADEASRQSGLADALSFDGNKFLPGSAAMALGEAFPLGGAELGVFKRPPNDPMPANRRAALNLEADELYKSGATEEMFQDWAKRNGMKPFGEDLAESLKARDNPSVVAKETPQVAAPETDVVTRLTTALNNAGKATEEQRALYKEERSKRFARVADAQAKGGGKAAYEESLAAMKGELPKADFEAVEGQFTPDEVFQLYDTVSGAEMSAGSKLSAHSGLDKLLKGELPQPKELENLSHVFPQDFIEAAMSNKTAMSKTGTVLSDVWNAPKSLQSTADLSGPLRQGLGLIHRGEFWNSLGPMVKAALNPKFSKELENDIRLHPNYDTATDSGLSITTAGQIGEKEDFFRSHLAEKIPVWGKVIQGSERAYVGFLNKLRFDTFNTMLQQAADIGHDVSDPAIAKGISRYINVMSGRGGLGDLESASTALNNVFYSPGLISSRLQILTAPVAAAGRKGFIADLPVGMRKEAAKSYAAIIGANTTALSLAVMAGNEVNLDPRSSDFLKMKDGNTRLDFGGGLQQYIVAATKALTREATAAGSAGQTRELIRKGDTPLDNDIKFVINKMHPSLTLFLDQQRGSNTVGEPFEWQKAIIERLTPMGFPDIADTLKEHGGNPGVFYGFLGLIGAGLSNYQAAGDAPTLKEFKEGVDTAPVEAATTDVEVSMEDFLAGEEAPNE